MRSRSPTRLAPANFQTPVNIQIVTKRGTNSYHGRIEGTLTNNALNANNPRNHDTTGGHGNMGGWICLEWTRLDPQDL